MPQCNRNVNRPPALVRPEYGEQCGPLSDRNGIWKCDSKTCYLHCNHGYIATDFGKCKNVYRKLAKILCRISENFGKIKCSYLAAKMSPKCSCSKFGDCSWFKPASCVKINPENGKCKLDEAPIGKFDCTGNSAGDLCLLQCPVDYKPDQSG